MKRHIPLWIVLTVATAIWPHLRAAEKQAPKGEAEDETVAVTATLLSPDQLKQDFGSDFDNSFTVLDVRVSPKGSKPFTIRLDDFILRSESSGDHSGPLLAAQIAGAGAMVVERTYADRPNAESSRTVSNTRIEMKDEDKANPALGILRKRILAERTTGETVSGLLFFPLSKEKPKNLVLSYKTPQSHLRLAFK